MSKLEIVYHDQIGKVMHVKVRKAPPKLEELATVVPKGCVVTSVRASTDFAIWLVEYDVSSVGSRELRDKLNHQFRLLLEEERSYTLSVRQTPMEVIKHVSLGLVLVSLVVWICTH